MRNKFNSVLFNLEIFNASGIARKDGLKKKKNSNNSFLEEVIMTQNRCGALTQ